LKSPEVFPLYLFSNITVNRKSHCLKHAVTTVLPASMNKGHQNYKSSKEADSTTFSLLGNIHTLSAYE
jgi:hypothetical protein